MTFYNSKFLPFDHFHPFCPLSASGSYQTILFCCFDSFPMPSYGTFSELQPFHAFNLLMPLSWTTDSVCVLITPPVGFRSLHSFSPFETHLTLRFYSLLHCLKPPAMVMSRTDGTTWNHEGGWFGRNTGHIQHPKHSHSQGPSFFLIFSIQVLHCFTLRSLPKPTLVLLSNGTQKTIWSSSQIIFLPYLHVILLLICH